MNGSEKSVGVTRQYLNHATVGSDEAHPLKTLDSLTHYTRVSLLSSFWSQTAIGCSRGDSSEGGCGNLLEGGENIKTLEIPRFRELGRERRLTKRHRT